MRWRPRLISPRAIPGRESVHLDSGQGFLAQCVVGERVVQVDRRSGRIRGDRGVREKFGVTPRSFPTTSLSSVTLPTVTRAFRGSERRRPRERSRATERSSSFPPRFSIAISSMRCCSRSSRRCESMRRCLPTSTNCGGAGRRLLSRRWSRRSATRDFTRAGAITRGSASRTSR